MYVTVLNSYRKPHPPLNCRK